ncbi:hypothetical protein [Nesterenkonia ebinurensis]|uniref:hypothetical protein n=1 Tax=Nesterenkonia ebinurensis TaxID=2608252 RepID=UPI00123CFF6E|nr:hypothetical protein [Nesterenkonia ebinurensis]
MRWESLFADLEVQAAAERQLEFEAEVSATVSLEWSRVPMADRLRAHRGSELRLRLRGGIDLRLVLNAVGADWLAGVAGVQEWLIPQASVLALGGLEWIVQEEPSQTRRRLGLASPLRALAASRERVSVLGEAGVFAEGVLCGVGLDFIDVRTSSGGVQTLPMQALVALRSSAL